MLVRRSRGLARQCAPSHARTAVARGVAKPEKTPRARAAKLSRQLCENTGIFADNTARNRKPRMKSSASFAAVVGPRNYLYFRKDLEAWKR